MAIVAKKITVSNYSSNNYTYGISGQTGSNARQFIDLNDISGYTPATDASGNPTDVIQVTTQKTASDDGNISYWLKWDSGTWKIYWSSTGYLPIFSVIIEKL